MNKNIEVINDNLLLINFSHINQCLINEIEPVQELDENVLVALNRDGRILLNKIHPGIDGLRKWFTFVMRLSDKQLVDGLAFKLFIEPKYPQIMKLDDRSFNNYIRLNQLEEFLALLNDVTSVEKERRELEKEFKKKNRFKMIKNRFKSKIIK